MFRCTLRTNLVVQVGRMLSKTKLAGPSDMTVSVVRTVMQSYLFSYPDINVHVSWCDECLQAQVLVWLVRSPSLVCGILNFICGPIGALMKRFRGEPPRRRSFQHILATRLWPTTLSKRSTVSPASPRPHWLALSSEVLE